VDPRCAMKVVKNRMLDRRFPFSAGQFPGGPDLSFLGGCDGIGTLAHGRCLDASFFIYITREFKQIMTWALTFHGNLNKFLT
jgi:hypothetical protein